MKPGHDRLVKLSNSRTKVVAAVQRLKGASVVFASCITDGIAPPLEFGTFELEREEDDDACNGNAARPSC
ncbi:unnamed protein product [Fusarium graminearum]|nr:unnamed protein product [Fusarium graminearum]